jgi:hypothetical protein
MTFQAWACCYRISNFSFLFWQRGRQNYILVSHRVARPRLVRCSRGRGLTTLYFYARRAIVRDEQAPPPHFLDL